MNNDLLKKIQELKSLPKDEQQKLVEEVADTMFGEPEDLHPDLVPWVEETSMGTWVKHPLVFSHVHLPQFNAHTNKQYIQKREAVKRMEEEGDWKGVIWMHERPYRLHAFLEVHENLDDIDYWNTLGEIWTDSENIWQNEQYWIDLLHVGREKREYIMTSKEREALAELPDVLTIYRGFDQEEREMGLSWTLDKKRAEWFAKRLWYPDKSEIGPCLAEATVLRESVIAHLLARNEDEIIVAPEDIETMTVTTLEGM